MDEQKITCYVCINSDMCPLRRAISEVLEQEPVAWVLRLPNNKSRARWALLDALAGVCPHFERKDLPL